MTKKIHIATYGCQMNDYESDRTYRLFRDLKGYDWTDDPHQADLILFNTCSIRDKADHKAVSEIGKLRTVKKARPEMILAVGGCLAQMEGRALQRRFPHVDIVFGTHQWDKLPDLVESASEERRRFLEVDLHGWKNYSFLPYHSSDVPHPVSELVTVQNGCDKFCTYCLVPFARGREVSRPHPEIVGEVHGLVERGVREVTLLGQNVNAYGQDRSGEIPFVDLLKEVAGIDGLERIRFMTSHPSNLNQELIDAMASMPKVCEHLHLPIQSGSNRILQRMMREYTVEDFLKLAEELKRAIPQLSLTTDFIVGFPSETEEEFEETLEVLRRVEFDDSYSFVFSPRRNTKAIDWEKEFVPPEVADERLQRLMKVQEEVREQRGSSWIGEVVEVLVEGEARRGEGFLRGKTRQNCPVNFPGPKEWISTLQKVQVTASHSNSRKGISVGTEASCRL